MTVTNFLLSRTVKEFWKSVNIWWSYGQELGVLFFLTHSVVLLLVLLLLLWVLLLQFNGLFSRTTWVSQYQKGETTLDLNEARDDGVLGCSGISWTICKQPAPRSRQTATPTPHHSILLRSDAVLSGLGDQNSAIQFPSWQYCLWNIYYDIPRNILTQNYNVNLYNKNIYTYTHLTAICLGLPGSASTRKVKPSGFYWSKRQWVAVASAGL